jgi:hypothetical protein
MLQIPGSQQGIHFSLGIAHFVKCFRTSPVLVNLTDDSDATQLSYELKNSRLVGT